MTCIDCVRRKVGCHSTCVEYQQEKHKREMKKAEIKRRKGLEQALDDREFDRLVRGKKKHAK